MRTAQQNADAVRGGYVAFAKGDMQAVGALLAADICWHMPGHSPLAGTYRGPGQVFKYLATIASLTAGTYRVQVRDVLASEDHVAVLVREIGQRGDARLDADEVHMWRMTDGRAAEFWPYRQDSEAVDRFWS